MRAYIYQADIYCEPCIKIMLEGLGLEPADDTGDSDDYPQGPYADGGGEADCPQHCGGCGEFLENPLTDDGRAYVLESVRAGEAPEEWRAYYTITL